MGLFDTIFKPNKAKTMKKALNDAQGLFQLLTAYQPVFTTWNGKVYESELVRAAIDARARHISKLKVTVEGAANPRLQTRMRLAPNPLQTYSQFLYRVSTILDCTNNCFIVPVHDDNMNVTGYFPILPQMCSLVEYKGEPWARFQFSNGKTGAALLSECALLTKFQYQSDIFGSSNAALDETMSLIHIQNQGITEAVKNSATYRFFAQLSNFAKDDDLKKEREKFSEKNLSAKNGGGGLLLFPNTYSNITQITQTAYTVDAAQREAIENNVHDYFGVNRAIMQNTAKADDLDAFFEGAIEPFAIQFSETMTAAMFSERERAAGARLTATANRLQYMSTSAKVQMAKELGDRGAIMIDEIRELFNYAPLPDGAGKKAPIRGEYYYSNENESEETN